MKGKSNKDILLKNIVETFKDEYGTVAGKLLKSEDNEKALSISLYNK